MSALQLALLLSLPPCPWHELSRCRPRAGGDPYAAARRCRG